MVSIIYHRFKLASWIVLTLLFATGAYTKYESGRPYWEVYLNGGLAVVSLIMVIYFLLKPRGTSSKEDDSK